MSTHTRRRRSTRRPDRVAAAARLAIETLEGRLLLAAEPVYAASPAKPLNAVLTRTATAVQLVDLASGTVLAAQPLAGFSENVTVRGSTGTDALTFDPSLSAVPLHAIDVEFGYADSVTFAGNLSTAGGSLTVVADRITVAAAATLSTVGQPSGAVTFTGRAVTLGRGAQLLADGARPADVKITADDAAGAAASIAADTVSPVLVGDRAASITATGATVRGNNVTLAASAETQTRWDELDAYSDDIADQLLSTIGQVSDIALSLASPLSGQVKIERATATVTLTDATVVAAGRAAVTADAAADSSFTTVSVNSVSTGGTGATPVIASVGYGEANTTAAVTLDGSTSVTAGGDVTVGSDTTNAAQVKSRGTGNGALSGSDDVKIDVALGIAMTTETSTVTTGPGTTVQSRRGDVALAAAGDTDTEASGDALLFQNGLAGFAVGVSVDRATVTSTVNGAVLANPQGADGFTFAAATGVDPAADTVTFAGVDPADPIRRGQRLTYTPPAGSNAIGGLTPGQAYAVADVATTTAADGTLTQTVHLARADTLDLDAAQTALGATQSLGKLTVAEVDHASLFNGSGGHLAVNPALFPGIANGAVTDGNTSPAGPVVTYRGPDPATSGAAAAGHLTTGGRYRLVAQPGLPGQAWLYDLSANAYVAFAGNGGGAQAFSYLTGVQTFAPRTAVNADAGTIAIPTAGLHTGDVVYYNTDPTRRTSQPVYAFASNAAATGTKVGTGTKPDAPVAGLNDGFAYFVTVVDANHVRLTEGNNAARAVVSPGAVTDAGAATAVDAAVTYPLRSDTPQAALNPAYTIKDVGLEGLNVFLGGTLGLAENLFNSYAVALAGNPQSDDQDKFAIGLGLDLNLFTNEATARIAAAAAVNQTPAYQTAAQSVAVDAHTTVDTVDVGQESAVNLSVPGLLEAKDELLKNPLEALEGVANPFGVAGKGAIGPTVVVTQARNTTTAEIQTGATLTANGNGTRSDGTLTFAAAPGLRVGTPVVYRPGTGSVAGLTAGATYYLIPDAAVPTRARLATTAANAAAGKAIAIANGTAGTVAFVARTRVRAGTAAAVDVAATTTGFNVAVAQTGARASDFGISASITLGLYADATTADIGTDAVVTAATASVTADDTLDRYGAEGGFVLGKKVGVGAAVGYNTVDRTTRAFVGADTTAAAPSVGPVPVNVTGAVDVSAANHGHVVNAGLAAAVLSNSDAKPTKTSANGSTGGGLQYGGVTVAVGASVAINEGTDTARAFVNAPALAAGSLSVDATTDTTTYAEVVGGAVDKQGKGGSSASGQAQGGVDVGLGGAFAVNRRTSTADASVRDAVVALTAAGGLAIAATDTDTIYADGGGVALVLSLGSKNPNAVSVGLAGAVNAITGHATASVSNARVTTPAGGVSVDAVFAPTINTITIAGAGAVAAPSNGEALTVAGAAAGSENAITGGASATVTHSTLTAGGDVAVRATDAAVISADAGAAALAATLAADDQGSINLSVAASVAVNEVTDVVAATVTGTAVTARNVTVSADVPPAASGAPNLFAVTIGGSVAVGGNGVAFTGAGSRNVIDDTVDAIVDGGTVTASGAVAVSATDAAAIRADGGGFALAVALSESGDFNASGSFGAAVAINQITNEVYATIRGGAIDQAASVAVTATSDEQIDALTLGGALSATLTQGSAFTFAGAGSGSGNQIGGATVARIADVGTSVTTTGGAVLVTAAEASAIAANGGAVAAAFTIAGGDVGLSVAVGASVAINSVDRDVEAAVDAATITSARRVDVRATEAAAIHAITVAGALAATVATGSDAFGVSVAGAGTASVNTVGGTVTAELADRATVTASGGLTVAAADTADLKANASSGAISATIATGASVSIGVAVARNTVGTATLAVIDGSTANAKAGNATVTATSAETVYAQAASAAFSLTVDPNGSVALAGSGAGVVVTNDVHPTVTAAVRDGATLAAGNGGYVAIAAADTDTVTGRGGGASLAIAGGTGGFSGALALSAAVVTNTVRDTVDADVTAATVRADGTVALTAREAATVRATAAAVDAAVAINDPVEGFSLALAGGYAQGINDVRNDVDATVAGPAATVTGLTGVSLRAEDKVTAAATVPAVSITASLGVSVSVAATVARSTVADAVDATVDNATVAAPAGGVVVTAVSNAAASTDSVGVSTAVGLGFAGVGGASSATVGGRTQARLAGGAVVTAKGEVDVAAVTSADAETHNTGGVFGLVTLGTQQATARVSQDTRAAVDGKTRVTAGALKVVTSGVTAGDPGSSGRTATAEADGGVGGIYSGQGLQATATIDGTVAAEVGPAAIVNVTGALTVAADSNSTASANTPGFNAGAITVTAQLATAALSGGTTAAIDAGANVSASSLALTATSVKSTTATLSAVSIGQTNVTVSGASATDSAATTAVLGDLAAADATAGSTPTTTVAGSAVVSATSKETTAASADGTSGGLYAYGSFTSTAASSGSTAARVARGASVSAGSLTVAATDQGRAVTAGEVTPASDKKRLKAVDGIGVFRFGATATVTGDTTATLNRAAAVSTPAAGSVSVTANSAPTATATANGFTYGLFNVDLFTATARVGTDDDHAVTSATINDGATVTAGTVNVSASTNATTAVNEQSKVISGLTGVAKATADAGTYADALASIGQGTGGVPAAVVHATSTGPDTVGFLPVGSVVVSAVANRTATTTLKVDGDGGVGVGITDGSSAAVGNTTASIGDGATVTAARTVAVGATSLRDDAFTDLSAGSGGIVAVGVSDARATSAPNNTAQIGQGVTIVAGLDVTVGTTAAGDADTHAVSKGKGGVAVAVAEAHTTYTPTAHAGIGVGGSVDAGRDVSVTAALLGGSVDPLDPDDGYQVAIRQAQNDWVSTAVAAGGSQGLVGVSGPTAVLTATPVVFAGLDADHVTAGRDVAVNANAQTNSAAAADSNGGGVVAVGDADGRTNVTGADTAAEIGAGSAVTAHRDVTLASTANHRITATANADNQGLGADGHTTVHDGLTGQTTADVGTHATVAADGLIRVDTAATALAYSRSTRTRTGPRPTPGPTTTTSTAASWSTCRRPSASGRTRR